MKYLLLALVIGIAWHLWRSKRVAQTPPPQRKPLPQPETMVHCEHCGVHLPQSNALGWRGHYYCSQAHLPAATDTPRQP